MKLKDKVAIVTGGGSGFGEGIARRFAEEGAKVAICDINKGGIERVAAVIHQAGGAAVPIQADISRDADWTALVGTTLAQFGRIDTVVNNAGWTYPRVGSVELSEADFDRVFAVNVKSIYLSMKHVVPVLRRQGGGGLFISIGSTVTRRPVAGLSAYGATKSAVIAMSESLALEFGAEKIRFNVINPAFGETGLAGNFTGGQFTERERSRILSTMPLGRLTTPQDIASAAVFLASEEAAFMTGAVLQVDGGRAVYG